MSLRTILVAAEPFGKSADASAALAAIGRGLRAGDPSLEVDGYSLEESAASAAGPAELRASLDATNFDARMRAARAVVIAAGRLDRHTLLRRGAVFEIATRARQGGVPCYAIAAHNALDPFEARILDLQVVLEAGGERGLSAAGRKLAGLV